jgi:hypothetical protein
VIVNINFEVIFIYNAGHACIYAIDTPPPETLKCLAYSTVNMGQPQTADSLQPRGFQTLKSLYPRRNRFFLELWVLRERRMEGAE